tara:strand:- start:5050 stop:5643 length:594 start_codon:yes stop_codon:yes gene_type:complete
MALPKIPPLKGKSFFFLTTTKKVGQGIANFARALLEDKKVGIPMMVRDLSMLYHREALKTLQSKSSAPPSADGLRTTLQPYAQNTAKGWAVGIQTQSAVARKYMMHINKAPSQQVKAVPSGEGSRFSGWGKSMGFSNRKIHNLSQFDKRRVNYIPKNFAGTGSRAENKVIMNVQKFLNPATIRSLNKGWKKTKGGKL